MGKQAGYALPAYVSNARSAQRHSQFGSGPLLAGRSFFDFEAAGRFGSRAPTAWTAPTCHPSAGFVSSDLAIARHSKPLPWEAYSHASRNFQSEAGGTCRGRQRIRCQFSCAKAVGRCVNIVEIACAFEATHANLTFAPISCEIAIRGICFQGNSSWRDNRRGTLRDPVYRSLTGSGDGGKIEDRMD